MLFTCCNVLTGFGGSKWQCPWASNTLDTIQTETPGDFCKTFLEFVSDYLQFLLNPTDEFPRVVRATLLGRKKAELEHEMPIHRRLFHLFLFCDNVNVQQSLAAPRALQTGQQANMVMQMNTNTVMQINIVLQSTIIKQAVNSHTARSGCVGNKQTRFQWAEGADCHSGRDFDP